MELGTHPRTFDTADGPITLRKSLAVPVGMQALYKEGQLLAVAYMGDQIGGVKADAITMNPLDYEAVCSYLMGKHKRRAETLQRAPMSSLPKTPMKLPNVHPLANKFRQ